VKLGLLGLIQSDLTDVDYNKIRWAAELGFHGLGAHLTVPAVAVSHETALTVKSVIADQGLDFLQLWGPYPCIISADEPTRQAGVAAAREIVKLAALMGVPAAGVRPTSLNPQGDWWPHPDNHTQESEDRFVRSLREILETAADYGTNIILEIHVTTVLDSPQRIKRIIERAGSDRVKLNLDPANFIGDLTTAFNPTPVIEELFDVLGPFTDTVHVKDYYLEDRFIVHISETIPGAGMMDLDTILRRTQALSPDMYAIIEHLPLSQVPQAKRNLTQKIQELGLPLGQEKGE
jgi:sugar phosphate isomerase/epimerase